MDNPSPNPDNSGEYPELPGEPLDSGFRFLRERHRGLSWEALRRVMAMDEESRRKVRRIAP